MSDLDKIIERCEGPELKEVAQEVTDRLLKVVNDTINGEEGAYRYDSANWEKFYGPALRHGILRRLAAECGKQSDGWYEVFCNNVREASSE